MSEFDRNTFEEMYSDADETLDHYDMAKHIYITQQAKIELIEKELTETQSFLNNQNRIKQAKIDELQARIDGALKELELLNFYRTRNSDNAIDILKGNKDEN